MYRHVRRRIFALIRVACAAFAMAAASAHAQTCTVSMTAVAFGNVDVLTGAAADTTATLAVSCSGGGAGGQRVCISLGAGSAGDSTSRILNGPGGGTARYELYSDASRTVKWGSWQTGYDLAGVQLDVAQNASTNLTVYARFAGSQQNDLAGTYTSTFTGDPFIQYADRSASPCPTGGLTASTSASASANVVPNCNVSATNINFGTIALLTSNKDAQGTLSIQCNATLPYAVSLSGGNAGATDPTQRKMALGGGNVTYGLYQDSARTQPWGDNPGTNTNSGTGNGALQNIAVYARIAPQTTPSPGTYSDTIIATVSY